MKTKRLPLSVLFFSLLTMGLGLSPVAIASAETTVTSSTSPASNVSVEVNSSSSSTVGFSAKPLHDQTRRVCSVAKSPTDVVCASHVETDKVGKPDITPLPAGLGPAQFHGAYAVLATSANPGTIAIVVAYDAPNIKADLDVYNKTFGLPVFPSCTTRIKSACFTKMSQNGTSAYPAPNPGWALEASMDVEIAHQMCQNCKLILVEARSASYNDLMLAVDRARLSGATVISNSWGSGEFSGQTAYDSHFNYSGLTYLFASGDSGYGTSYPAASRYAVAIGGTTLTVTPSNAWLNETVWSGAGSGCSAFELKPAQQHDALCAKRTIADIAADADPASGAAVYDSYRYNGQRGWFQVGGTSLATPLVAGVYGLANDLGSGSALTKAYAASPATFHDITVGTNGTCGSYLCQGGAGYDGPTGLGSPLGLAAF